jgi:hypothetical protein
LQRRRRQLQQQQEQRLRQVRLRQPARARVHWAQARSVLELGLVRPALACSAQRPAWPAQEQQEAAACSALAPRLPVLACLALGQAQRLVLASVA